MRLVKPKKFLGQHFLKDLQVAQDIADTVDTCPDLPILEVGPGMGVLTQFLIPKGRQLKVVELDFESVAYLRENFAQLGDNIIEKDFLKMDLSGLFGGKPFVLTGNYPYNISSQIFFKMLDYKDLIPCCTGMIQKEVAERIAAAPGSKTYGILSILIQAWYKVEYLFTVHEHVFNPPPKVKSAVIRMTRNDTTDLGCNEKAVQANREDYVQPAEKDFAQFHLHDFGQKPPAQCRCPVRQTPRTTFGTRFYQPDQPGRRSDFN